MKKILTVLIILFAVFGDNFIQAQNRFPLLRERINQAKLREIRMKLNIDAATFQKFRPIYLRYEHEISALDLQRLSGLMRINADSLTTAQADLLITNQIEVSKKLIAIREKYYKEFKTVLEPQQVIKIYQTEAELRRRVMAEIQKRRLSEQKQ